MQPEIFGEMSGGGALHVRGHGHGQAFVVAGATALPHLVHPGRNGYLLGDPAARRSLGGGIGPQSVPGHGRHRTLAAFEALCIHGAAAPSRRP
ncbi:hypothetical protein [Streptomyces canus]|uniref:hypothetical protein n=1 Tax=Streptomyces canus TaxID=58343 RepID=UPI002E304E3B|nr:hypothetical protein [Streptomyces canus]